MTLEPFDYDKAFSRNIGWLTEQEQRSLKDKVVAIAGCGGVGGIHALTMARLGVGHYRMADFDAFGVENFNRQVGANMNTIGQPKLDVMLQMVRDINPDAGIQCYEQGVNGDNVDAFLDGVDVYIDSLDFFAIEARKLVFARCYERNIPAITAAPLGMGTAFLAFLPGQMSFEDYFGMQGASLEEQFLRFYLGLAPAGLQSAYLVDPTRLNLAEKRGPSTIIGCTMSAGVAAAQAIKLMLGRGDVIAAPRGTHWDPYLNKMEITHIPHGHQNPTFQQRLREAKAAFGIE
ncbi:ThiF family adenylyltransferase [Aestuariibacter halophilus]|uniref:ThiF family adenylyltransferase n=1 Tax=Fluctibacter halophilus TaxID=226011 RepID=A0ABS8G2V0_9ALTE|nr:ThiF family adenylyltransferase [Aestuariibacter halophilus]MCC2614902.1 ThiF family adenylyltransferase [Aestuariibacter halophilus]